MLLELSSQDLIATASQGSTMAVAVRSYLNDARSDLYTVRSGSLHGPFALTEEPTALAVSNAGTAVLSASGVTVYNTSAEPQWHNDDAVGARYGFPALQPQRAYLYRAFRTIRGNTCR